jgi:hypothetical protein
MSHGVAKEGLGIFRTYRCSCLPHAQPRALPGARLCRRSAALVGRRLMRNYFGQHCLKGGDKTTFANSTSRDKKIAFAKIPHRSECCGRSLLPKNSRTTPTRQDG